MNKKWLLPAGLAVAALVITGCGSSGTSSAPGSGSKNTSPGAAAASTVKTATIGGVKVLTNSKGFTLYWFALDTSSKSKCNGGCATIWPPLKGPVTAGTGVTGTLATITRSDGSTQATYNGHPLYTYTGDSAPGQNKGNGLNVSGGIWHEVAVSGTAPSGGSSSSPGGGGGYGY